MLHFVHFLPDPQAYASIFFIGSGVIYAVIVAVATGFYLAVAALGLAVSGSFWLSIAMAVVLTAVVWLTWQAMTIWQRFRRREISDLYALASDRRTDRDVGVKARALGELAQRLTYVPAGFVVTRRFWQRFAERTGTGISSPLERLSLDERDNRQRRLAAAVFDRRERKAIRRICRDLPNQRLIVRSSFLGEDGESASFAGLFRSLVVAADPQAVALAIKEVWSSYYGDDLCAYLANKPEVAEQIAVAGVIVQPYVECDYRAVTSTVNLVDRRPEEAAIELVDASGGRRWLLPWSRISQGFAILPPSDLGEDVLRVVRDLASSLDVYESTVGGAAEIEWGIASGRLVVFQVRRLAADFGKRAYTNSFVVDLPNYPLTTLSASFLGGSKSYAEFLLDPLIRLNMPVAAASDVATYRGRYYVDWVKVRDAWKGKLGRRLRVAWRLAVWDCRLTVTAFCDRAISQAPALDALQKRVERMSVQDKIARLSTLRHIKLEPLFRRAPMYAMLAGVWQDAARRLGRHDPNEYNRSALRQTSPDAFMALRDAELMAPRLIELPQEPPLPNHSFVPNAPIARQRSNEYLLPFDRIAGALLRRWSRSFLRAREGVKRRINAYQFQARLLALAIGKDLFPTAPGAVFHLRLDELLAACDSDRREHYVVLAQEREKTYREFDAQRASPVVYRFANGDIAEPPTPLLTAPHEIAVVGVSGQQVSGPVVQASDGMVGRDHVIYLLPDCRTSFIRLFRPGCGAIACSGSALSHLAMLARDLHFPFAICERNLFEILREGEKVTFDPERGAIVRDL